MSNPAIVRAILKKIKNNGSCTLEDLRRWFPQYFTDNAAGGGGFGYHPPDDFRQLVRWGLIVGLDGSQLVELHEIDDARIKNLTFKLSDFAITLENVLQISLTASPFFGTPQPFHSKRWADIFMLMPFRPETDVVFNVHVQNVASSLGLQAGRADNESFHSGGEIVGDIWSGIYHAKFIVADCTSKNSNVFYEIGIAHTLGKPTILISQTKDDVPFDLQSLRLIIYENTTEGLKKLEGQLKSNLEDMLRE
ncbi:MAG: hypothetical protein ACJ74W_06345 [Pyrinomonadaceae bacterium]